MDFFTLVGLSACFYFLIYAFCLCVMDCDIKLAFAEKFGKKLVKLRGKVIWITNASSELGKMIALKAAKECGKLVLSSSSSAELEKIKDLCLKVNPFLRKSDILILQFDIGETNCHNVVFQEVIRHFGTLDILIMNEDKREKAIWEDATEETDRLLFQTNLFGILSLSRLSVRYFTSKQKGKLAVTSSLAGLIGVPYSGCYSATKHALHGYFDSLRFEKIGENIKPILLCLGSSNFSQEKFTVKENKLFNSEIRSRKKMGADRCAHLCLTAIVNGLDEAWMGVFPILPLIYAIKYFPNITRFVLKYLKSKKTKKIYLDCVLFEEKHWLQCNNCKCKEHFIFLQYWFKGLLMIYLGNKCAEYWYQLNRHLLWINALYLAQSKTF